MSSYTIESIRADHPALLTRNFAACAVARCRESKAKPWSLNVECDRLPHTGTRTQRLHLTWEPQTERDADGVERSYQANRVTEEAAVGVCAASLAAACRRQDHGSH